MTQIYVDAFMSIMAEGGLFLLVVFWFIGLFYVKCRLVDTRIHTVEELLTKKAMRELHERK